VILLAKSKIKNQKGGIPKSVSQDDVEKFLSEPMAVIELDELSV